MSVKELFKMAKRIRTEASRAYRVQRVTLRVAEYERETDEEIRAALREVGIENGGRYPVELWDGE